MVLRIYLVFRLPCRKYGLTISHEAIRVCDVVEANFLPSDGCSPAAIIDEDAVPARVIPVYQRAKHALVRIHAGK